MKVLSSFPRKVHRITAFLEEIEKKRTYDITRKIPTKFIPVKIALTLHEFRRFSFVSPGEKKREINGNNINS